MTEQDKKDAYKALGAMLFAGMLALALWPLALLIAFGRIVCEIAWWGAKPMLDVYVKQRGETEL